MFSKLYDLECDLNILEYMLTILNEDIENIEIKTSNGLSHVFMYKNPEINYVYQYFKYPTTVNRIKEIFNSINFNINKKFLKYSYKYNILNNLSNIKDINNTNIIIWEKINCLNFLENENKINIILNNIIKFFWDIGKALYGLHINNILHNDARIDNIGIKNNNFKIFDFDGTNITYTNFDKDIYDLKKSLEFNLGKEYNKIKKYTNNFFTSEELLNYIISIHLDCFNTIEEIICYLDNLEIIY